MKHTPGPWSKDEYNDYAINGADGMKVAECAYMYTVKDGKSDFSEMKGNAHLIAAAPDLLESLEIVLRSISNILRQKGEEWDDNIRRCYLTAFNAIKKAKGEA